VTQEIWVQYGATALFQAVFSGDLFLTPSACSSSKTVIAAVEPWATLRRSGDVAGGIYREHRCLHLWTQQRV